MPADLATQEIVLVRLGDGDTPSAIQTRIEAKLGAIDGEVLSWLDGPWCYVSGGYAALLTQRGGGVVVDQLCREAGAAEAIATPFAELQQRLNQRSKKAPFLRDAGAKGVAAPGVVGNTVPSGGRQIALDWQITVAGIDTAWSMFNAPPGELPWKNIRVGHIDTGCTRHPALGFEGGASKFVFPAKGLNLFADYLPPPMPGDPTSGPPEETDAFDNLGGANGGHGTRTLSVLGGFYDAVDGSEAPFYGAAPGVAMIPYRVTNSILIDHVQRLIAEAIDHAVGTNQCRVISMSLGGIVPYGRLAQAIDRAYEAGVIVCAAAGNVIREVTYPGRYNRAVTVGGVSPVGSNGFKPWDGASRGQFVDVCGPASGVRRASVERRKGKFDYFIAANGNGTSYATALCAGIAALWLARREADPVPAYSKAWCWPAAFKRLLKETAECPAGWDTAEWGRGLYRADKLLAAALPPEDSLHKEASAEDPFDPLA